MKFSHLVISLTISIFLDFGLPAAQSQNEAQPPRKKIGPPRLHG